MKLILETVMFLGDFWAFLLIFSISSLKQPGRLAACYLEITPIFIAGFMDRELHKELLVFYKIFANYFFFYYPDFQEH